MAEQNIKCFQFSATLKFLLSLFFRWAQGPRCSKRIDGKRLQHHELLMVCSWSVHAARMRHITSVNFRQDRRGSLVVLHPHPHIVLHCQSGRLPHRRKNGGTHQFTRRSRLPNRGRVWDVVSWIHLGLLSGEYQYLLFQLVFWKYVGLGGTEIYIQKYLKMSMTKRTA